MKQEKTDLKLAKEVNWLYSRLNKKEMGILMKWISANCDIVKQQAQQGLIKEIEDIMNIIHFSRRKMMLNEFKKQRGLK